jgi:hypothetical protein
MLIAPTRSSGIDFRWLVLKAIDYVLLCCVLVLPFIVGFFGYIHLIASGSWALLLGAVALWIVLLILYLYIGKVAARQRDKFQADLILKETELENAERNRRERETLGSDRKCRTCVHYIPEEAQSEVHLQLLGNCDLHKSETGPNGRCPDWVPAV